MPKLRVVAAVYLAIGLADALYGWSNQNPALSTSDLMASSAALVFLWPAVLATKLAPGLCATWRPLCL